MAKKAIAPTERKEADMFTTADSEKFLDVWCDYCENTPKSKWDRTDWLNSLVDAFEDDNPNSKRTQHQKRNSCLTKALYIKRRLKEEGHGCPPLVGGVRRSIAEIGARHKDRLDKWK